MLVFFFSVCGLIFLQKYILFEYMFCFKRYYIFLFLLFVVVVVVCCFVIVFYFCSILICFVSLMLFS